MTGAPPPTDTPRVLAGVRVVEIADAGAQYAGKLLTDLGAEVIKVEPLTGDAARRRAPYALDRPGPNRALLWWQWNSGKKSIALDLGSRDGRALLHRLLATAHVALCSGDAAALDALGAPFDALRRDAGLIVTTVTPFGWSGPRRPESLTDLTAQAAGGLLQITGFVEDPPTRIGGSIVAHHTSLHAAVGTLIALFTRRAGGPPQHVDVSMQESVAAAVQPDIMFWDLAGETRTREGATGWRPGAGLFPARDGWVGVHTIAAFFDRLIAWMDGHGLAGAMTSGPEWLDPTYRMQRKEDVLGLLRHFCAALDVDTLVSEGQDHRALVFPVLNTLQVIDDPQVRARGWLTPVRQRALDAPVRHPGPPFRLARTPWRMRAGAPDLGQDTASLLAEIGLDRTDLAALSGAGVVA